MGAKLRKLPRQAKICTPPGGDARAVSRHVCLDMSGHVRTCPDTRWTQVHCMRKYALETSPGADCENMCSAKVILSPYGVAAHRAAARETCRVCTLWKTGHAHARTRVRRDSLCGKSLRSHQCVSTINERCYCYFLRAVRSKHYSSIKILQGRRAGAVVASRGERR